MQPPYSRTLFELLEEQSSRRGEVVAVISGAEAITWRDLVHRARQAAGLLRAHGINRGDRVGLLANNRPEWLEVAFGAWLLGAVLTPFSTWSTRRELEFLLADSGADILVSVGSFGRENYAAILADLPAARDIPVLLIDGDGSFPDYVAARKVAAPLSTPAPGAGASAADDAIVLYSSGSTSRPKAIPLAHYLVIENGFNIGERQGLTTDDKVLVSPPLFWAYGGVNALPATFGHGATLILQGRFEPGEALDLIERHHCTSIYTLPGMTDALVRHPAFRPERTRSLRTGLTIGSPQDVIKAATALGVTEICNIYGASETGGNCCVTHRDLPLERRAHGQGMPLPGVELRIVDESTGEICRPGEPGLVEVRGPYVTRGYAGASASHNKSAFTEDGWFRSGDLGMLSEAGEMVFVGRSTEMIKRAGINVSPSEVEDVLMQHEAIAQAGVVGVPTGSNETIVAYIVLRGDRRPNPEELATHCRALASGYKVPDRFEIVDQLPVTTTGKLMRRELKELATRSTHGAPA